MRIIEIKKAIESRLREVARFEPGAEPADTLGRGAVREILRHDVPLRLLLQHVVADLLGEHPALMKRPVIREGDKLTLGWAKATQAEWL